MLDPKFDDFIDHREYGVQNAGPLPFSPLGFAYVLFGRRSNFNNRRFSYYEQINTGKSFEIPSLLAERLEHIDVLVLLNRAYDIATSYRMSLGELRQKVDLDSTAPVWEVPQDIFHEWLTKAACNPNQDGDIRDRNISYGGTIVHLGGDNTKPWVGGEIVLLLAINYHEWFAMSRGTLFYRQDYWVHRSLAAPRPVEGVHWWYHSRTPDLSPIQTETSSPGSSEEEKEALLRLVRHVISRVDTGNMGKYTGSSREQSGIDLECA